MPSPALIDDTMLSPVGRLGRAVLEGVAYVGGLTSLFGSVLRSFFPRPRNESAPLLPALLRQATVILGMGLPLVVLLHVAMGSFLSMQAYFGGTFVDGTGAVVGVGLIRNLAPLMTGLLMAGLLAALMTPELRGRPSAPLDEDPRSIPDRGLPFVRPPEPARAPDPGRLAAARIGAAVLVAPLLILTAVVVGTMVGWQIAQTILGISTDMFFSMFFDMLWVRDVVGLIFKGMIFGLLAALFACHEGLRGPAEPVPAKVPAAACRAACLSSLAILVINSGWFLVVYHAGPVFGPTLMAPPAP